MFVWGRQRTCPSLLWANEVKCLSASGIASEVRHASMMAWGHVSSHSNQTRGRRNQKAAQLLILLESMWSILIVKTPYRIHQLWVVSSMRYLHHFREWRGVSLGSCSFFSIHGIMNLLCRKGCTSNGCHSNRLTFNEVRNPIGIERKEEPDQGNRSQVCSCWCKNRSFVSLTTSTQRTLALN